VYVSEAPDLRSMSIHLFSLHPFHETVSDDDLIVTSDKFYFTYDRCIITRHAVSLFENDYVTERSQSGFRCRGYLVDVGVIGIREYKAGKREYKQLEIDFVANKGSDRIYIQSAYRMDDPDKQIQELRPFLKINDGFRKIVLVGDDVPPHVNEKGIRIMNVIDFMKDPNSLEKI